MGHEATPGGDAVLIEETGRIENLFTSSPLVHPRQLEARLQPSGVAR